MSATITVRRIDPGDKALAAERGAILNDLLEDRVLNWTARDARACARIVAVRRRQGEPLDNHLRDAMLAGSAANRGLVVVTRNTRDFRDAGVRAVDPWSRSSRK